MLDGLFQETRDHMERCIEALRRDLAGLRTGKASPRLLDGITVEAYGSQMPLNQVATLSAPEPRLLTKVESDRSDASGFISHARRDPTRRSDPGAGFPWTDFFRSYQQQLSDGGIEPDRDTLIRQLQSLVGTTPDGIVGPQTRAALNRNWLGRDASFDPSVADTFVNNPRVVEWVQTRINARDGFSVSVDGQFGPRTDGQLFRLPHVGEERHPRAADAERLDDVQRQPPRVEVEHDVRKHPEEVPGDLASVIG